jgi:hypothetical protein
VLIDVPQLAVEELPYDLPVWLKIPWLKIQAVAWLGTEGVAHVFSLHLASARPSVPLFVHCFACFGSQVDMGEPSSV